MVFQFETGAFRHPALVPDKPERRSRPIGTAKHSFQKLVRARGTRASIDPRGLVLASSMIHMPRHDVPLVNAVIAMRGHWLLSSGIEPTVMQSRIRPLATTKSRTLPSTLSSNTMIAAETSGFSFAVKQ
jgi:hypothetical protein